MTLTILAFGVAKDILGGSSVRLDSDKELTIGQLKSELERSYPELCRLTSFAFAVNNEYAGAEQVIREHDEIAIIPPVSGG